MMDIKIFFSVLAGVLGIAAYIPYIIAIIKKTTTPAKASWIIWAILQSIVIFGMYLSNTLNGQIIADFIGSYMIVFLALKYGNPDWTKIDKLCFGGVFVVIFLWLIFNNPIVGIIVSLMVLFLGSIPTFISAWNHPEYEDKLAWVLFFASGVCAIISIPSWTLAAASQPVTFLLIISTMMYLLYIKPMMAKI